MALAIHSRGPRTLFRVFAAGLASVVVGGLLAVLPAQIAVAATLTVTNCNDSGAGSLRQAVLDAASGDTIGFALPISCTGIIYPLSTIDITTNLTITGAGGAVQLQEVYDTLVFQVASGVTANLSQLFIGGRNDGVLAGGLGGGIDNAGGTLNITDCTLADNVADRTNGGAIDNEGGTVNISNSVLEDNGTFGNFLGSTGGAIYNSGTLTVTDSNINSNAEQGGGAGGGIYNTGTATITGSTVANNTESGGNGGGIDNAGGTVTVTDSTVANNVAIQGNGGGIDNEHGTLTVTNSTVSGNVVQGAVGGGGGISNDAGTTTVSNSTVSSNRAGVFGGGGLYRAGGTLTTAATIVADSLSGGDCSAGITDHGYNLDDDGSCGFSAGTDISDTNPLLDPLGLHNNGGPTVTVALEPGSPAIGAVTKAALCSTPDQRGNPRATPCDIGAYQTPAPQVITITSTAPVNAVIGGPAYSLTANGGGSGNPVTFAVDATSTSGCSMSGLATVSFSAPVGTCVIDANQVGNTDYVAAPEVQQSFSVAQASQAITFTSTAPSGAIVGGASYTVMATGGGSGNPVIFTIDLSSTSGCVIAGAVVTFPAPVGTCVIDANQVGNTGYSAGPQVQQVFSVLPNTPPPPTFHITNLFVPHATRGQAYSVQLQAIDGKAPYKNWKILKGLGLLPKGLTLSKTTGVLSGTPGLKDPPAGYAFVVQVSDSSKPHQSTSQLLVLSLS